MSIVVLVDENPNVASAGLGDSVCVLHSPRQRNHADNTHGLRRSTDRVAFVYRYESHSTCRRRPESRIAGERIGDVLLIEYQTFRTAAPAAIA